MTGGGKFVTRSYTLVVFCLIICLTKTEEMTLNVNVKKPVAIVSEKFLSITLDPVVLFNSDFLSEVEKSTNMARALSPAYVRIGGPRSNSYVFERRLYPQESHSDPDYTLSETHWINVHQWAERSGLDVIASIAPHQTDGNVGQISTWDPRNALDLISFSDRMGYNTSWQLGYECQTRCDISGTKLGQDVQRLRNMLDAFPRYAERALIAGPDVVTYRTRLQQQYLQDYFNAASGALSAVTWHPDFASISIESKGVAMHYDNLAFEKDSFYRIAGRHIVKKPLWIAESRPEECKRQFLGALVWARRLGNSAKLGIQVLMRQPDNSNLFRPTPDYWVSLLHKMLVGREVLDTKIAMGNRTHVHFYCHCSRASPSYEKGSLTVFGINLTPSKVTANLKGLKLKVVHKYILLPGYDTPNRMFAETVLLNNKALSLINGKEVPDVQPVISSAEKGVKLKLPSGGIGFWVLPGLKIKTCMGHEDDITDKNLLRKINKRLEDVKSEEEENSEEDRSQEFPDFVKSTEEKKSAAKQFVTQKRQLVRRSRRHRNDEKDDLEVKKVRRFDGSVRHDVDRLEQNVRRKDHHFADVKNVNNYGVFENDDDEDNVGLEEDIIGKVTTDKNLDSGEEIRAKLQEYKRRLADYENRKKLREQTRHMIKERIKNEHENLSNKGMDTGKVIEALTLMTKVESAMKNLEKENTENENQTPEIAASLGTGDFIDVTSGLPKDNAAVAKDDDVLLDEVLKSEKSKRTSVPTKIEDQLKALYHLLSEEKEKREGQPSLRQKRNLDKLFGDENLGIRYEGITPSKRSKFEDVKERRQERLLRLRERLEQRRAKEEMKKETEDSNENNFYGFLYRAPLENFPKGDLYLQTDSDLLDSKENNYENPDKCNKAKQNQQQQHLKKKSSLKDCKCEHEDIWLEEGDSSHMPKELYENVKLRTFNAGENFKKYEELWEEERKHEDEDKDKHPNDSTVYFNYEVVTEKQISEAAEDHKAKEKSEQQLLNYYGTNPNEKLYDFEELIRNQEPIYHLQQINAHYQQNPIILNNDQYYTNQAQNEYVDANGYYINPLGYPQTADDSYYRIKRHTNDIEDVLRQEMISQDDNNLRDCQCRVIRGQEDCKDCNEQKAKETTAKTTDIVPNQIMQNSMKNDHTKRMRMRRNVEELDVEKETTEDNTEETIDSVTQAENIDEVKSEESNEELEEAVNGEISLENSNETIETTTVNITDQLKLENDFSEDNILANRLPRKIQTSKKLFINTSGTTSKTKENPQIIKKEISTTTVDPSTSSQPTLDKQPETISRHLTNIRSITNTIVEISTTDPSKIITEIKEEAINQKQPLRIEILSNTDASENTDKTSRTDSDREGKDKDGIKITSSQVPDEQSIDNQNNKTQIFKNLSNVKAIDSIAKNNKKINIEEPNSKPKNNNLKINELVKTRQARLTTRAEALAALKKENESRRAKKMIETSLKIIDNENARLSEFQKKRREQLDRLKLKLRAKREKMLQQYKDELLEAINENSDLKDRNLRRRDLFEKSQKSNYDSKKSDIIIEPEKLAYIMRYTPIKYTSEEDAYESNENEKYVPMIEVIEPYYDSARRQLISRNRAKIYRDNNDEYDKLKDEEINDTNDYHEYQKTNIKRLPYYSNRFQSHNHEKPIVLKGESIEYYAQQQEPMQEYDQQYAANYYPHSAVNEEDVIPLHITYNQQPANVQQDNTNYYAEESADEQQQSDGSFYNTQAENSKPLHDLHYNNNRENMHEASDDQADDYDKVYPKSQYEQQSKETTPNNYDLNKQESSERNNKKSKRSSLKIFEIDPSMYEEGDTDYNLQKLFVRPSSKYHSRRYRHEPCLYNNRRYRRDTTLEQQEKLNEPLSIKLGLDSAKMNKNHIEADNFPLLTAIDKLFRIKRESDFSNIKSAMPYQISSVNKNIKKAYKASNDGKYNKFLKILKRAKRVKKSTKSDDLINKEVCEKFNDAPWKINIFKSDNYLNNYDNILSQRRKRSFNNDFDYAILRDNEIRSVYPEMNEIWNEILEMKKDEELLQEYDQQKKTVQNFEDSQRKLRKNSLQSTTESSSVSYSTTTKNIKSTTQANIEAIISDAIPKLENVITGGLRKAQNLTGSVENFIEDFDDQFVGTSQNTNNTKDTGDSKTVETTDEGVSRNIFNIMVGNVKKFFGLVSAITKIFQNR